MIFFAFDRLKNIFVVDDFDRKINIYSDKRTGNKHKYENLNMILFLLSIAYASFAIQIRLIHCLVNQKSKEIYLYESDALL